MKRITPEELFPLIGNAAVFDARSPGEFQSGHIPGAVSCPLFDDEERAAIGTIYKQVDSRQALLKGLEFAGPKMRSLVEMASSQTKSNEVVLYCWRGGQRSAALGWLLGFSGLDVRIIDGGYKAYRRAVLAGINDPGYQFLVLGGKTGSGKTELLHVLGELGEQIVDLEGLAHHKGSAFGWIDELPQPTTEQFENNLYETLRVLDKDRPIWIENESRGIGKVFLPAEFAKRMGNLPLANLNVDIERRIDRLVKLYVRNKTELRDSFCKIERKLGGQHLKAALDALDRDDFDEATRIALTYYDRTYQYGLDNTSDRAATKSVDCKDLSIKQVAEKLISLKPDLLPCTAH